MTVGQKSVLGLKLEEIEAEKAKERQKIRKGSQFGTSVETLPQLSQEEKGTARDKAAKTVGVSGATLGKAKKIQKEGTPEQKEKLVNGKASVDQVYRWQPF